MKTGNCLHQIDRFRLLVLVPHRDARLPLRAWGDSLLAAGLPSAGSFPGTAPLARLNRPLSDDELKRLARALREHIDRNGGILTAGPPVSVAFLRVSLFGPSLPIGLPDDFFDIVPGAFMGSFSPVILGAALSCSQVPENLPAPPPVSFRAGALANMNCRLRALGAHGEDGYSFEWKIGALRWMPKGR